MEVVRKELNPAELYDPNVRYNDETDTVEITTDGGETWTPAPYADPRLSMDFPPRITADTECDAAASMVVHLQKILEQVIVGASGAATSVVTSILLLFFGPFALLFAAIGVVVGYLIGLGIEDLTTMAEGTDWAILKCIINCYVDENGQLNQAGFDAVQAKVDSDIGGTNATIIKYLMQIAGYGGMNYASSIGTEEGDCSSCSGCGWSHSMTPDTVPETMWRFSLLRNRTYSPPTLQGDCAPVGQMDGTAPNRRWRSKNYCAASTTAAVSVEFDFTLQSGSTVDSVTIYYHWLGGPCTVGQMLIVDEVATAAHYNAGNNLSATGLALTGHHKVVIHGWQNGPDSGCPWYITATFSGTGLDPFSGG